MSLPARSAADVLDCATAGHLVVGAEVNGTTFPDSARSYLADGRGVAWTPCATDAGRFAIDAELAGRPVPPALARRANTADPETFWTRWTACEATAKVLDLPVLSWLSWPALVVPQELAARVRLTHLRYRDVLVCFATADGREP